ncbi:P-loop containing nucleoside triphosphate hydrolase protein [Mycena capillaripes]|nr:P-loop containing nucleoside triphosphate hydrolase protein [Mycena capillaripes]
MDHWRVVVLGDDGVGKTTLAIQLALNRFTEYDPTIKDKRQRQRGIDDRMCLVDDRFIREGQGFILAYSIASQSTFDSVETFHQAMRRLEREVRREAGALAQQYGWEFLETSGKTAHNVDRAFTSVVRALRDTKKKRKRKCIIFQSSNPRV